MNNNFGDRICKNESQNLVLPIHFFTIVLNGEPFIRYHIDIFKQITFKWHWHIIEGVADLKHDTGWSLRLGGKITDEIHKQGRSKDGTSEYLEQIAAKYPENVTIYRKPEGVFWDGKREMVNAPLANIKEECLLWQIDVDELWTLEQICNARKLFIKNPDKTAAFYWCWYFVGENLVISTRNCYAQNPQQDWLRTWRFKPGCVWAAHEPPILVQNLPDGQQKNVATLNPFRHAESEKEGLIFQHFAYLTPEQLRFKEQYYGYQNAVIQWQRLQSKSNFPVYLREYFGWVRDNTMVDRANTAPKIAGIQYRNIPAYDYTKTDVDRQILQQICDEEKADIFISTYYTTPLSTPSVFMAYDMIPEVMRWNLANPMWREKHNAIRHASAYVSISENTGRDLVKFFPQLSEKAITVAHCGVESIFSPAPSEKVNYFKTKYNITKPYFLLVGASGDYKNSLFFIEAFAKLPNRHEYDIVCTGACALNNLIGDLKIHQLQLSDEELVLAYSGALALVYPSKYEGFGLPIVEALACGCPVITCPNASIPEVAGTAAIYVKDKDVNGLVNALLEVQQVEVRQSLITAGLSQTKKFSWAKMADIVSAALIETAVNINNVRKVAAQISLQVDRVEQQLQQKTVDSSDFLNLLSGSLNLYEIDPFDESVLSELRLIRQRITDFWLDAAPEELEDYYLGNAGKAHQILAQSDFKNERLTESEQALVNELIANLARGFNEPKVVNYRLAAMLYPVDNQLLLGEEVNQLPKWLIGNF